MPAAPDQASADSVGGGPDGGAQTAAAGMGVGMGRGAGLSLRNLRTFSSFQIPVFRLYYAAMLGMMAALNMQMIARSLLVFRLTDSATALGIMALANSLPMLFFSLFGGVMADRVQKKHVLLVGQGASAVMALAIALSLTLGFLSEERTGSWLLLVGAALIQGTIMGLMMPSRQAMIADIVGEDRLMNAVALNAFGMNMFRLMGPAIAGFLIAGFGFSAVYYVMTGFYLMAVAFILVMPHTGTISLRGQGAMRDIKAGFQYVRQQTVIALLLGVVLVTVLLSMPYMMLLPLFTEEILDVGAGGLGVLVSVSGIGAMVGSLVLASLPNKRRGAMLLVGGGILGLALTGFAFSTSFPLSLVMILFVGLGQSARMALGNTLLMYYVTPEYRGRVMSIYMMEFGLTSLSVFFAALAADFIGVQWSVGGLAMVLVVLSVLMFIFVPRIRRLD